MKISSFPGGVWSATPTPLTPERRLDRTSIGPMVEQHLKLGVKGLMLAGTCGEGPWLRAEDRQALVKDAAEAARGRLHIAVQVTDNSPGRVLENIELAARAGAEIAIVDAPWFVLNATPAKRFAHYREVVRESVLPLGLYDRGQRTPTGIPAETLPELLADRKIAMVKDSSQEPVRREHFLAARRHRPELAVLNGDEFDCVTYLVAGYNGLLLGGGIFNGAIANRILEAVQNRNSDEAQRLQARMNDLMLKVYGGPKIECWLAGLKELLVQLKVFRTRENLLDYPLTDTCRSEIAALLDGSDGGGYREDVTGAVPSPLPN